MAERCVHRSTHPDVIAAAAAAALSEAVLVATDGYVSLSELQCVKVLALLRWGDESGATYEAVAAYLAPDNGSETLR